MLSYKSIRSYATVAHTVPISLSKIYSIRFSLIYIFLMGTHNQLVRHEPMTLLLQGEGEQCKVELIGKIDRYYSTDVPSTRAFGTDGVHGFCKVLDLSAADPHSVISVSSSTFISVYILHMQSPHLIQCYWASCTWGLLVLVSANASYQLKL